MQNLVDWKIRTKRTRRILGSVMRWTRNGLAALGVCFLYLLVLGYFQYLDQVHANEPRCTFSRCT